MQHSIFNPAAPLPNIVFTFSRSLEAILKEIDRTTYEPDLLDIYWGWPITEVRCRCVAQLRECTKLRQLDDKWNRISHRIKEVISAEIASYPINDNWEQLLVWYLSNDPNQGDAFGFAIGLITGKQESWLHYPKICKAIYGAIKRNPDWYWAPSVPEFLEASLASDNWTLVERALDLICLAEDTSFLPLVSELSRKAREEKEKKEDFKTKASDERFADAKARGVLAEAVRHLLICQTEQQGNTEDFQIAVAQAVREFGNLKHLPQVTFSCPEAVRDERDFHVRMLMVPDDTDAERLLALLQKCELNIRVKGAQMSAEGAEPSRLHDGYWRGLLKEYLAQFKVLSFQRKVIRLNFVLVYRNNGDTKLAQITRYIHRAD